MKIADVYIYSYILDLKQPLSLRGPSTTLREGYLFCLETEEDIRVWGDAAPLPGFSAETLRDTEAVLRRAAAVLRGLELPDQFETLRDDHLFRDQADLANCSAYFAIESACLQLMAQARGEDTLFPGRTASSTLLLNALLPATDDEAELRARASGAREAGYAAVKLKVGAAALHDDIQRTKVVRECIGPEVALRLDANRVWDLEGAFIFAQAVRECFVEYIEEPVNDPILLPAFLAKTGTPYALDETLQRPADVLMRGEELPGGAANALEFFGALLRDAAAWVWKPTLLQRPILDTALQLNPKKPVVLSGAFESGVGHAAIARYAAAYSGGDVPVGLDTYRFLKADLLEEPLPLAQAKVDVAEVLAAGEVVDLKKITWRK